MEQIYDQIYGNLHQGRPFALATILSYKGSTPRTSGTRMMVFEDKTILGTIGGGLVEAKVIEACAGMLASRPEAACTVQDFILNQDIKSGIDMVCGGDMRVWIEIFEPAPDLVPLYERLADLEARGKTGILVSTLTRHSGGPFDTQKTLVLPDGETLGAGIIPKSLMDRIQANEFTGKSPYLITQDLAEYIVEPCLSGEVLYIFGAGHVGLQLSKMAALIDLPSVIIDDRAEFANSERFPNSRVHVPGHLDTAFESLDRAGLGVDANSYIVILTRGHLHDQTVLDQALKTNAAYIGMIGSRRKREQIYENLMAQGVAEADLSKVFSPVGIKIASETPAEIAVSIIAQVIQVRRGGK